MEEDQVHQDKTSWDQAAAWVWMDRDQGSTDLKEAAIVLTAQTEAVTEVEVEVEEEAEEEEEAAAEEVEEVVEAVAEVEDRPLNRAGISCEDFVASKVAVNFFTRVITVHHCLNKGSLLLKGFANRIRLTDASYEKKSLAILYI